MADDGTRPRGPGRAGGRRPGRRAPAGRRGGGRRGDHRRGPGARPGRRGDRRRRPARHPGLRRHPHALRRAGDLGRAHDAVELARRHDGGHGQLRRRLRTGAARCAPAPDLAHGRRRGHSGCRARRGDRLVLGELRRVSRRRRAAPARHRPVRAAPPRRAAPLRHGRAGGPAGGGHTRGRRGHAHPGHRGPARRGHRVLDVADAQPPHGQRGPDAVAARRHATSSRRSRSAWPTPGTASWS